MSAAPIRIAVAMACHDRRETTLRCLADLFAQATATLHIAVHLLDDASSDGTAAAVARAFPQVTLLAGDGSRFWSGGMFDAMRSAGTDGYDFLLWLNDDVRLRPDAIARLLDAHREAEQAGDAPGHVIAGACIDPRSGRIRYGGLRRASRWHPTRLMGVAPDPARLMPCDAMHGNCVLLPIAVVRRVGPIDPAFVHQSGDIDYGYRATRAGIALWLARTPIGECRFEPRPKPWLDPALGLRARWRAVNTPLGYPLRPWLRFMWRHGGLLGVAAIGVTYLRLLFPRAASSQPPIDRGYPR